MSFSGALGRGTYQGVIAGAHHTPLPKRYYPLSEELLQLHFLNGQVMEKLQIRDKIFMPKFQEAKKASGMFYLTPQQRKQWHVEDTMQAIRKRSIVLHRIRAQQAINQSLIDEAKATKQRDPRLQFTTPDAAMYFEPEKCTYAIADPNFWHHSSKAHLLPKMVWQRHAELGNATRVSSPRFPHRSGDF